MSENEQNKKIISKAFENHPGKRIYVLHRTRGGDIQAFEMNKDGKSIGRLGEMPSYRSTETIDRELIGQGMVRALINLDY